jgi:hypothetical protein
MSTHLSELPSCHGGTLAGLSETTGIAQTLPVAGQHRKSVTTVTSFGFL